MRPKVFVLFFLIIIGSMSNCVAQVFLRPGSKLDKYNWAIKRPQAIKIGLFAPVSGHIAIGYERVLKDKWTIDTRIGIIGTGLPVSLWINDDPERTRDLGFYIKGGPKRKYPFRLMKNLGQMLEFKPLMGWYFRPDLVYSMYTWKGSWPYFAPGPDNTKTRIPFRATNHSIGLILNVGAEWVIGNHIIIDMYMGAGVGYSKAVFNWVEGTPDDFNEPESFDPAFYMKYSHIDMSPDAPLVFTAGMNLGWAFK